jgi:hypothetical protein
MTALGAVVMFTDLERRDGEGAGCCCAYPVMQLAIPKSAAAKGRKMKVRRKTLL